MNHLSNTSCRAPARNVLAAASALAAVALTGCGTKGDVPVAAISSTPAEVQAAEGSWVGRDAVKEAIALLGEGKAAEARERLIAVLKKQPGDTVARQLVSQIDEDPQSLLGSENYSYTLKEGETLSSIAQGALGNPMMFYALARYNDIAVPASVAPGQTILVPGKRPEPARAAARKKASKMAPAESKAVTATKDPAAPSKPTSNGNPAQAAVFRGQGLAALNGGAIDRAVALLRRASSLDPANEVIKNDLNRALRIQNMVRSKPSGP